MGTRRARDRAALGDRALIAAAASALCLGGGRGRRQSRQRASTARRRWSRSTGCPTPSSRPGWRRSTTSAGPRTTWSATTTAIAHAERGIAIARANGEGRLLLPLMLVKGYPFEMQGRLAEALEMCEAAVEGARLSANPHYLRWALFELGWAHYYLGDLDAAIAACEESAPSRRAASRGHDACRQRGPGLAACLALFERGDLDRAFEVMEAIGGSDLEHAIPVERCFYWEILALAELARGRTDAAEALCQRKRRSIAARLGPAAADGVAQRARAAVLLAAGDRLRRGGGRRAASARTLDASAPPCRRRSRAALQGRALAAAGEREQAIEVLREAERVLDGAARCAPRDEARRELRKLGARAEARGPATGDDSGIGSLTKRELEIAELITDRMTNPQIASKLFLSKKTVESHIRNLFVKLGAPRASRSRGSSSATSVSSPRHRGRS